MRILAISTILLLLLQLFSPPQDNAAELKRLQDEYTKEWAAFIKPYEEASTDEARMGFKWDDNPSKKYIPLARALAEKAKSVKAGEDAAMWIWRLSMTGPADQEAAKYSIDYMIANFPKSAQLGGMVGQLGWIFPFDSPSEARAALKKVIDAKPNEAVLPAAWFALAQTYTPMGGEPSKADLEEARKIYAKIRSDFKGSDAAQRAEASLFEAEKLQIGMVAPDFETVDENGVKWKLSDYRGKVVIVDFWGFW